MGSLNKIHITNSNFGYRLKNKENLLLKDLNITADQGELISLIGTNGSGKSTLLKTLANLHHLLSGEISFDNKPLSLFSSLEFAKKVAFVSSEIINVGYLKVKDLVALGRFPHQKYSTKLNRSDRIIIERSLRLTGMLDFSEKNINEISDGERQKLMIARALAQDTDIILLDEPTAFLDISNKIEVLKILKESCEKENKTIIFSTHDLNMALKQVDKVWLIKDKNIIEGAPEDLMIKNVFDELFKKKDIKFNSESFEFEIENIKKYPIRLTDKSNSKRLFKLTLNALIRKGYFLSDSSEIPEIIIEDKRWSLYHKKGNHNMKSLYDLMNILSKLKF